MINDRGDRCDRGGGGWRLLTAMMMAETSVGRERADGGRAADAGTPDVRICRFCIEKVWTPDRLQ